MITGLPKGARRAAFEAVVDVIQQAPAFCNNKLVKRWLVHERAGLEVTIDMMPAVRLTLMGGPIERLSVTGGVFPSIDIRTKPTVVIETWVKGYDVRDSIDLYEAIDGALFPASDTDRAAVADKLGEVGISDWEPTRDVLPETPEDYTLTSIHSTGAYRLTLDLSQ